MAIEQNTMRNAKTNFHSKMSGKAFANEKTKHSQEKAPEQNFIHTSIMSFYKISFNTSLLIRGINSTHLKSGVQ